MFWNARYATTSKPSRTTTITVPQINALPHPIGSFIVSGNLSCKCLLLIVNQGHSCGTRRRLYRPIDVQSPGYQQYGGDCYCQQGAYQVMNFVHRAAPAEPSIQLQGLGSDRHAPPSSSRRHRDSLIAEERTRHLAFPQPIGSSIRNPLGRLMIAPRCTVRNNSRLGAFRIGEGVKRWGYHWQCLTGPSARPASFQ
jgi:hypothetical protein